MKRKVNNRFLWWTFLFRVCLLFFFFSLFLFTHYAADDHIIYFLSSTFLHCRFYSICTCPILTGTLEIRVKSHGMYNDFEMIHFEMKCWYTRFLSARTDGEVPSRPNRRLSHPFSFGDMTVKVHGENTFRRIWTGRAFWQQKLKHYQKDFPIRQLNQCSRFFL